jgi:hypothetical protein
MAEKTGFSRRDLKGPDEFISTFGRTVAWCKENRSKVAAGAIGVFAVVALALGTRAYLQWEENKSARDLWPTLNRAQELLQAPFAADPSQLAAVEQFLHLGQAPLQLLEVPRRRHLGGLERRARQAVDALASLACCSEDGLQHGAGLLGGENAPDLALAGGARLTQERMIEERAEHVDFSPPCR